MHTALEHSKRFGHRYVLESENFWKFFDYMQLPSFEVSADVLQLLRNCQMHKSTIAAFLSKNYDWFLRDYNTKLLESNDYITRRQGFKLLADILLAQSNSLTMVKYVSSNDNVKILMILLRVRDGFFFH